MQYKVIVSVLKSSTHIINYSTYSSHVHIGVLLCSGRFNFPTFCVRKVCFSVEFRDSVCTLYLAYVNNIL